MTIQVIYFLTEFYQCVSSKIWSFSSKFLIYMQQITHSISLLFFFNVCRVGSDIPSFIPDIGNMHLLSFSLGNSNKKFTDLVDFFTRTSFWFH